MSLVDAPDFGGIPLDTVTIPQKLLNIDNKERTNLFPWNGQFSPQLIEALLQTFAHLDDFVLDPFLGSGTVLHEAGRRGHAAFGSEVNPAALKMAEVYRFINLKAARRRKAVEEADELIEDALPAAPSLFSPSRQGIIASINEALAQQAARAADFCKTLIEALIVLLNYGAKKVASESVLSSWRRLRETVQELPFSERPIELANCDARALPLPDQRADIVITSPPYINVFNYHQQYRRSVESLGWDLLEVARSEIGSNRKHRGNRFLTVIQYCLDMSQVFAGLRRVCRPGARIIVVVGRESNVRKTRFFNGEIVARLAVLAAGYQLERRQERVFQNRFGEKIYEDILLLTTCSQRNGHQGTARDIARDALIDARKRAPEESLADLDDALERLEEVQPSPLYNREAALPRGERPQAKENEVV
jgi:DNA modification methylase